jgi:hypothetical protein
MHRPSIRPTLALTFISTVVVALACSDATSPSGPKHPIVGVYDITASLQTYEYTSGTSMPYTYSTVPAGPATLSGTLTIDDTVVTKPGMVEFPLYLAAMQETPCAGVNPPCTSAGATRSAEYTTAYTPLRVSGDTMGVSGGLGSPYETIVFKTGTFAGDSIVGTLDWNAKLGPAHEIYRGTYVARRHH